MLNFSSEHVSEINNTDKKIEYFDCSIHGKVKTKSLKILGINIKPFCPECKKIEDAKLMEQEIDREMNRQLQKSQEKYFILNIDKEYWNKNINDFKAQTESQKQALYAVNNLIKEKQGKVVLLGSNGVGKTFLGSMVVKELGGFIYSMYEITAMIRQSYTIKAVKSELEIVRELAFCPMLVIDEIGRTKGSDAEMNWLSYILDKRHTNKLPFMLLSNRHLKRDCPNKGCDKCFERYVDNDILSRLRENTELITIQAPDYRLFNNTKGVNNV